MTENKLTLEDCFKYPNASMINLLGLKCESVVQLIIYCFNVNMTIKDVLAEEDFKFQLRSIEQLTDEEKDFIVKEFSFRGRLLGSAFFENVEVLLINCSVDKRVGLIDYFRKQNIMIEPEDWFKSGKAVKDEDR